MHQPKIIILSAPSGTGKSTLCARLLKSYPKLLTYSISATTRAPRGEEQNGFHYHFLSHDEFRNKIDQDDFAEWALFSDQYYGTLKSTLEHSLSLGLSVLLDIEVQGADQLRRTYPDRSVSVFLKPPNLQELERRLRARGTDSEEKIQRRLQIAHQELQRTHEFDVVIVNDDLERAYQDLSHWIEVNVFQCGSNKQ